MTSATLTSEVRPYFEGYISEVVLEEIGAATQLHLQKEFETLVMEFLVLETTEDVVN